MNLKVGVLRERASSEHRVALTPNVLPALASAGMSTLVERGAGEASGFRDAAFVERGATLVGSASEVLDEADVLARVSLALADPDPVAARHERDRLRPGQILVGFAGVFSARSFLEELAGAGVVVYAMELIPRVSRAQGMDALSSMATVAGYKAAVIAAERLSRMFPMLVTAAGTLAPARVFVLGAGVAGLSAIATARRLGARVKAFDVRPEAREEIASLGAEPVDLELPVGDVEVRDEQGYAKGLGESVYGRQQEMLAEVVAASDVVITTAAVPGKKAPVLLTRAMVERMPAGSVVVDLAAETGGNCELTVPDGVVEHEGVTILGPLNLPSTVPFHASQMYARNVSQFLLHLAQHEADRHEDEILRATLLAEGGRIVHPRVLELWGRVARKPRESLAAREPERRPSN